MDDLINAVQDDPVATVIEVTFAPATPPSIVAALRRLLLELEGRWSYFEIDRAAPEGAQARVGFGTSKSRGDVMLVSQAVRALPFVQRIEFLRDDLGAGR